MFRVCVAIFRVISCLLNLIKNWGLLFCVFSSFHFSSSFLPYFTKVQVCDKLKIKKTCLSPQIVDKPDLEDTPIFRDSSQGKSAALHRGLNRGLRGQGNRDDQRRQRSPVTK